MTYKLGSLFDGSGGFPLAGRLCGVKPVWAAEVEPYPIAVTRSRFPGMKHLGDVSKIRGSEIEPVNIITFGSPCQGLSVAGLGKGLKDARSGLFTEAVRIIKEMREATNGVYPNVAIWENVPGAFSSNRGEDFRTVLEELIKIVEPGASMPPVPKGGWVYADSYRGDRWSLAYRTFDTQYWPGTPQRRRRIHLVLHLGGECSREILFERDGLRGDLAEGRAPWERAAGHAERSIEADDRDGNCSDVFCVQGNIVDRDAKQNGSGIAENVSHTLNATDRHSVAYCLQGSMIGRADKNGPQGSGVSEGAAFTLNTVDCHAVAYEDQRRYIVRRLTPTECARLQGFPDKWGHPDPKDELSDEEYQFWLDVRNTHAEINGKAVKDYTKAQMLKWYDKLHTDSAEHKMWGNGIALPPALYVMQGVVDALDKEKEEHMKVEKYVCDRCHKDMSVPCRTVNINNPVYNSVKSAYAHADYNAIIEGCRNYDLCTECAVKLKLFLEGAGE